MASTSQLSTVLITVMFVMVIIGGIIGLVANTKTTYGIQENTSSFDNVENKLDDLVENTEEATSKIDQLEGQTGVLDIIGSYIAQGWGAMKTVFGTIPILNSIIASLAKTLPAASTLDTLVIVSGAAVLVIFAIRFGMHYLRGSDRL